MANEKRLIYAEEAVELINGLESLPWEEETEGLVNSLTTVDAVEVVRCKDCKYINRAMREPEGCSLCDFHSCDRIGHERYLYVEDDDFCSMGERKDNV